MFNFMPTKLRDDEGCSALLDSSCWELHDIFPTQRYTKPSILHKGIDIKNKVGERYSIFELEESFTNEKGVVQEKLFEDRRVQLFLGKFLSGELNYISPVLDKDMGYRYPEVEGFIDDPKGAEPFLRSLQDQGLMTSEVCGVLACCDKCGSYSMDRILQLEEGEADTWHCRHCRSSVKKEEAFFRPVLSYRFSDEGIDKITDRLVVKPLMDFLHERGYRTESPGVLLGESNVSHSFDIIAYSIGHEEGVLVMDFVVSDRTIGESKIISMFAKVFDTTPLKSILVALPGVTNDAKRLAEQYNIEIVESNNVKTIWKDLRKVIPTVDEFGFEPLDVMTLLSLPDHLRKTAMVTSKLGKATADEIAASTNRARAVESGYLNQLVRMGYLKKERSGRKVLFSVVS